MTDTWQRRLAAFVALLFCAAAIALDRNTAAAILAAMAIWLGLPMIKQLVDGD